MIAYAVANTALGGLAITLVIRREYGILKRLRSTPLPASLYLAAVLLSNLFVVVLQSLVIVARVGLFDAQLPENWSSFLLALGLGAASFAGLGLAIAALVRSGEAIAAVVNVIVLPMSFLRVLWAGRRPSGSAGGRRGRPAALPDRSRPRRLRRRRRAVGGSDRDCGARSLGAPGISSPGPASAGSRANVRGLSDEVLPLAMQNLAQIAFVDDDGDIRVNFGMFAGREATRAEIDDLAKSLLDEVRRSRSWPSSARSPTARWRRPCIRSGSSWTRARRRSACS